MTLPAEGNVPVAEGGAKAAAPTAGDAWEDVSRLGMRRPGRNVGDALFRGVTAAAACVLVAIVASIALVLAYESVDARRTFGWSFLTTAKWDPVFKEFGALPFIYGTLMSSLLALLQAVPLGIGTALFLSEMAPRWLQKPVAFLVELLAAIPSVVYGLWGIFVLVPWVRSFVAPALADVLGFLPMFSGPSYGVGMLTASIVLAIMIVPYVTSVAHEVFQAVPVAQREAALALGATRWEAIRIAVLPYARAGIVGATMLGLGRALGETMAVTMVIGNSPTVRASLFAPGYSLPAVIANEFAEASGDLHTAALAALGLLLFAVTVLLNIVARILVRMSRRGPARVRA